MRRRSDIRNRLLLIVTGLNLAGIACFCTATYTELGRQGFGSMTDTKYLFESAGFTLMLPGIFFAAATLIGARLFAWSEATTCAVWYTSGFVINFVVAWRAGVALESV